MHFINHDLHLFQGGKENPIYAKHLPSATFPFNFRKTVADGKITDLQQQTSSYLFSLHREMHKKLITHLRQILSFAVSFLTKQTALLLLITRWVRERNTLSFHCNREWCTCEGIFSAYVCPSRKKLVRSGAAPQPFHDISDGDSSQYLKNMRFAFILPLDSNTHEVIIYNGWEISSQQ